MLEALDERGRSLGAMPREEVHAKGLLHRCVHVFVLDAEGRLWLQKRGLEQRSWPGMWTSSASGHVEAGEDERAAAVRELREELGLRAEPRRVGEFRFRDAQENEVSGLWEARAGEPPGPGPEVLAVMALDRGELAELRARLPRSFAPSFEAALRCYGWDKGPPGDAGRAR